MDGVAAPVYDEVDRAMDTFRALSTDGSFPGRWTDLRLRYPDLYEFIDSCSQIEPVGSRVSCDPPPLDTDIDYLCMVKSLTLAWSILEQNEFKVCGGDEYEMRSGNGDVTFVAFRRYNLNFIVTHDREFFDHFMVATHTAKRLNLLKKADRIALFQAVLYRQVYDEHAPKFCPACENGGWECYGIGSHDPHFRECPSCGNPKNRPSP